jgi:anti-anti-sigma factor
MSGGELARLSHERREAVVVARLDGDVDGSNSAELAKRIDELVPRDVTALVLDLTATGYLDSSGVQMLFDIGERLRTDGRRFCLCVSEEQPLHRILTVFQIELLFPMVDSLDRALAEMGSVSAEDQ